MARRWSDWKATGSYGTIGLEVVLSLLFGLFVGQWLDGRFGTAPILTLVLTGFGLAAAIRALVRAARAMRREVDNDGWQPSGLDRPLRLESTRTTEQHEPEEPTSSRGRRPSSRSSEPPSLPKTEQAHEPRAKKRRRARTARQD